jgi:hypothetical protein
MRVIFIFALLQGLILVIEYLVFVFLLYRAIAS